MARQIVKCTSGGSPLCKRTWPIPSTKMESFQLKGYPMTDIRYPHTGIMIFLCLGGLTVWYHPRIHVVYGVCFMLSLIPSIPGYFSYSRHNLPIEDAYFGCWYGRSFVKRGATSSHKWSFDGQSPHVRQVAPLVEMEKHRLAHATFDTLMLVPIGCSPKWEYALSSSACNTSWSLQYCSKYHGTLP